MPLPIAPALYFDGNLRVDVRCAEYFATPARGLRVSVDGAAVEPTGTNGATALATDGNGGTYSVWVPTDVGFVAPPGRHLVQIAAPDCAPFERVLELSASYPEVVTGRLALANDALRGPAGAPDGGSLAFGAFTVARPTRTGTEQDLWGGTTRYTVADTSSQGLWISAAREHRGFVVANDLGIGWASTTGTVQTIVAPQGLQAYPGALPYTGTIGVASDTLRLGARFALHDVAFAAGSGLGGEVTLTSRDVDKTGLSATTIVYADASHDSMDGAWYVPLWASVTIKPACDWGVQLLASYDVHPTALDESGLGVAGGFVFQPSASCREAPGIKVTPP